MATRWGSLPVGLLAAVLGQSTADADPATRERAVRMYADGALSGALAEFQRALEGGGNERADLVVIYQYLGVLRAGARDRAGAIAAFRAALSLEPDSRPASALSPTVREVFDAALAQLGNGTPLRCVPSARALVGRNIPVRVEVDGDQLGLAAGVRVDRDGRTVAAARGDAPFEVRVPADGHSAAGPAGLTVVLLDRFGSTLDDATLRLEGAVAPDSPSKGSILSSPWLWTGATVLIAGGIVAAVLVAGGSDQADFGPIEVYR